jgi:hypothetical protein
MREQPVGEKRFMGRLTFFEENALKKRILVTQHQAFICSSAMILLQGLQRFFIALDGGLELANVLCATLAKGGLGLSVALLTLLRSCVNLIEVSLSIDREVGDRKIKDEAHNNKEKR